MKNWSLFRCALMFWWDSVLLVTTSTSINPSLYFGQVFSSRYSITKGNNEIICRVAMFYKECRRLANAFQFSDIWPWQCTSSVAGSTLCLELSSVLSIFLEYIPYSKTSVCSFCVFHTANQCKSREWSLMNWCDNFGSLYSVTFLVLL